MDADVGKEAIAAVWGVEPHDGLVWSCASQGHIAFRAEVDPAGQGVSPRIQEHNLIRGAGGDRVVNLREGNSWVERLADRGAVRDATRDPLVASAPVNGPRGIEDPGPELGVRRRSNAKQDE